MKKLINLLRGYVEWRITGPFPERMLNLCAQERLPFWRVRWLDALSPTLADEAEAIIRESTR